MDVYVKMNQKEYDDFLKYQKDKESNVNCIDATSRMFANFICEALAMDGTTGKIKIKDQSYAHGLFHAAETMLR